MTLNWPQFADLAERADANLLTHAGWVQQRLTGMRVIDRGDLVWIDSGLPCDTFNFVLHARLDPSAAADRVREAVGHFRQVNRPFSWWVGPIDRPDALGELLVASGLEPAEGELAMAADLSSIREADVAPDVLTIQRVKTPDQLRSFAALSAANWSPPDPYVLRFYELAGELLLTPDAPHWFYVGYVDHVAVATSELTVSGDTVGLYNISTLPAYRRRGIGTAMTLWPLLDARAAGFRLAVLQAAPDGIGVYKRVGFKAFGEIVEFKPRWCD
jgi:ribosomal protein S18 acetylase RimI-like enzyme